MPKVASAKGDVLGAERCHGPRAAAELDQRDNLLGSERDLKAIRIPAPGNAGCSDVAGQRRRN